MRQAFAARKLAWGDLNAQDLTDILVYLQRQAYGEHKSWPEFHQRMEREKRVIIRINLDHVGPTVRG